MADELQQILAGMRAEGRLDSAGIFTVDIRKALPKLERFQLPQAYFGLLKVVQSGVASGAHKIEARISAGSILVEHDGEPPEPESLEELLGFLMARDHPTGMRALRDLAMAVNTSLGRGGSWVEVAVRCQDGWKRQRWLSREETRSREEKGWLQKSQGATVRFLLRRSAGQTVHGLVGMADKDVVAMLKGSRATMTEDERVLFDRCRNCPVPVFLNGRRVPPNPFFRAIRRRWSLFDVREHRRGNLAELYVTAPSPSPHLLSPPPIGSVPLRFQLDATLAGAEILPAPGSVPRLLSTSLAPGSCLAVISLRGSLRTPSRLTLVKDGVDLADLCPTGVAQGIAAVVTAERLPLDLSQFRLVRSPALSGRFAWVDRMGRGLARLALEQRDRWPSLAPRLEALARGE